MDVAGCNGGNKILVALVQVRFAVSATEIQIGQRIALGRAFPPGIFEDLINMVEITIIIIDREAE